MELVEAIFIAKMSLLDELMTDKQSEVKRIAAASLPVQADYLHQLLQHVAKEVVNVEFAEQARDRVIVEMYSGHQYALDVDWKLPPGEFAYRVMDQVIVTYMEDLYDLVQHNI